MSHDKGGWRHYTLGIEFCQDGAPWGWLPRGGAGERTAAKSIAAGLVTCVTAREQIEPILRLLGCIQERSHVRTLAGPPVRFPRALEIPRLHSRRNPDA